MGFAENGSSTSHNPREQGLVDISKNVMTSPAFPPADPSSHTSRRGTSSLRGLDPSHQGWFGAIMPNVTFMSHASCSGNNPSHRFLSSGQRPPPVAVQVLFKRPCGRELPMEAPPHERLRASISHAFSGLLCDKAGRHSTHGIVIHAPKTARDCRQHDIV